MGGERFSPLYFHPVSLAALFAPCSSTFMIVGLKTFFQLQIEVLQVQLGGQHLSPVSSLRWLIALVT
jgi:hypothetical protein